MNESEALIAEVEEHCRRAGVAETTFGRRAVNDGKFVRRVRGGGGVTTRTATRVRAYMSEHASGPPETGETHGG